MIQIPGHSNFTVKLEFIQNKYVISKTAKKKDSLRLHRQMEKQEYMYNNNFLINCKIPKILNVKENNDETIYYMDYIYNSNNVINFLYSENSLKLIWLKKNILNIIYSYISKCKLQKINNKILYNKINSVKQNIMNNKYSNLFKKKINYYLNYLLKNTNNISNIEIPIGISHGDLTLSNMLINNSFMEIYLIDFLDSFIESPILDIIKIRQDTFFYWTLRLCNFKYDINKIKLSLNKLDNMIDNEFKKYNWYNLTYNYFQILNLLRIVQYSKNKQTVIYIINSLDKINIFH